MRIKLGNDADCVSGTKNKTKKGIPKKFRLKLIIDSRAFLVRKYSEKIQRKSLNINILTSNTYKTRTSMKSSIIQFQLETRIRLKARSTYHKKVFHELCSNAHFAIFPISLSYSAQKEIFCEKISLSCIEILFSHSYEMRERKGKAQKDLNKFMFFRVLASLHLRSPKTPYRFILTILMSYCSAGPV